MLLQKSDPRGPMLLQKSDPRGPMLLQTYIMKEPSAESIGRVLPHNVKISHCTGPRASMERAPTIKFIKPRSKHSI